MCGINGIFNFDKRPVERRDLEKMNGRVVHRGPDGEGYFLNGHVGFSMRRLSVIDIEGGQQPMMNENGSIAVVMNGEIFNYLELKETLIRRGHRFRSSSDTEVIAHLYEEKGESFVEDLNGMFAIALHDSRSGRLLLYRDRAGIKPLFYCQHNGALLFSSDLRAINSISGSRAIDTDSFLSYLGLSYVPCPRTIFKGISKLEPGHYMKVGREGLSIRQYWDVRDFETLILPREADYADAALALFRDSVRLQMRSDVPVGAFLSGGLDSSFIVGVAAKESALPINTFSAGFEGGLNELPLASLVSLRYGTIHDESVITGTEAARLIPEAVRCMDEPISDNAAIPTLVLSRRAAQKGIKVVLNGAGGDELFGGYRRYRRTGAACRITGAMPPGLRRLAAAALGRIPSDRLLRGADSRFHHAASVSGVSYGLSRKLLKDRRRYASMIRGLLGFYEGAEEPGDASRLMYLDFKRYLPGDLLSLFDKVTMGLSIEGRVPFLDHRLIEFCFSVPDRVKFRGGRLKGLLRNMIAGVTPPELLMQQKAGFAGPTWNWVRGPLREEMTRDLVHEPAPFVKEHIDSREAARAISRIDRCPGHAETLYSLYVFNMWCRMNGEGRA